MSWLCEPRLTHTGELVHLNVLCRRVLLVLTVGLSHMCQLSHTLHVVDGPLEAAGGPQGPLSKNLARVAI